jgi:tryptophanyl-tRNA synthetase
MSVVTDSQPVEAPKTDFDKNIPLQLYKAVATPEKARELQAKLAAGGFGYGDAKKELLATLTDYFAPFRKKREELVKNLDYVQEILRKGAERANVVATETMERVRLAVGLR